MLSFEGHSPLFAHFMLASKAFFRRAEIDESEAGGRIEIAAEPAERALAVKIVTLGEVVDATARNAVLMRCSTICLSWPTKAKFY